MSNLRVTVQGTYKTNLAGIQQTSSHLQTVQDQMSSNRQITKPSDNPSGTATALQLRGEISRMNQYVSGTNTALGWLGAADTAFNSANSMLQKVRTLTVQGLNSGSADTASNSALAAQVTQLSAGLLSLANTQYLGRPLFGGTLASPATAFAANGTYQGTNATMTTSIGPGMNVSVGTVGSAAFGTGAASTAYGAGSTSVFSVLNSIATDMSSGNTTALSTDLTNLDTAMATLGSAQSVEGAMYSRVQAQQTSNTTALTSLKSQLADLEEPDLAEMAIEVTSANTAYQAALATTAKVGQTSLLDFLK